MRHFRLESILLYLHRISVFTQNLGQTLTYIFYQGGVCYLSPILDVCTHEVLAYRLSDNLRVDFVLDMVDAMCSKYGAELDNSTIVHSDQGCHYIVIELHGMCDVNTSIQIGRELDQYNCLYLEEPGQSMDYRYLKQLHDSVKTFTATGERIGSLWGFKPFIENRAIDVAQPDLGVVGGITEMKKVCDYAHAYDVGIQMHCMAGPIACAATVQVEAAIPNFVYHECLQWNTLPVFTTIGKYDDMLIPVNGTYQTPDRPGIGQELSEEAIAGAEHIVVK